MATKKTETKTATPAQPENSGEPKVYNLATGKSEKTAEETLAGQKAFAMELFSTPEAGEIDLTKLVRRGMPTLITPEAVPVGAVIQAKIKNILNSPTTTIKGFLLHLDTGKTEFTFPCTGVIRQALAPGIRDDEKGLRAALEKEIGKTLVLRRLPSKPSKFKKEMYCFDVFTS